MEMSARCWTFGREIVFIDLSLIMIELQGSVDVWEIVVMILVKILPFIQYSSSIPPFLSQSFCSWT